MKEQITKTEIETNLKRKEIFLSEKKEYSRPEISEIGNVNSVTLAGQAPSGDQSGQAGFGS